MFSEINLSTCVSSKTHKKRGKKILMNYTLEKFGNGSAEMLLKVISAQRRTVVRKKICKFNDSFQS